MTPHHRGHVAPTPAGAEEAQHAPAGVARALASIASADVQADWRAHLAERLPPRRGFFTLGLVAPRFPENVGAVLRAAHCYGAAAVAIEGSRHLGDLVRHATNTPKAHLHMPVWRVASLLDTIPFDTQLVAVDLVDGARPLPSFVHPERAFYVFGPENGTLGARILDRAVHRVMVPTRECMNLAACVNVVLYDRMAKRGQTGAAP